MAGYQTLTGQIVQVFDEDEAHPLPRWQCPCGACGEHEFPRAVRAEANEHAGKCRWTP